MGTGPQKYPGASTAHWYQDDHPGAAMEANVGVIHTTEGTSLPSYGGGATAPTLTAVPDIPGRRLRWYQHFDFDTSARALVNASGGVETNTLNCVQVELVGTCDPARKTSWDSRKAGVDYLYWPDAPDWALAELAAFVKWSHDEHGVKLQSTVTWKAYPASYGTSNGVRLTGSQWQDYYGWLGHQHVPENTHGDPGALDFARVLAHAKGTIPAPDASKETDVPQRTVKTTSDDLAIPPRQWKTLGAEGTDLLKAESTGAIYDGAVHLTLTGVEPGTEIQGRFYHNAPDGKRKWTGPIVERAGTGGSSFVDFAFPGQLSAGELLRFELLVHQDEPCTAVTRRTTVHHWAA